MISLRRGKRFVDGKKIELLWRCDVAEDGGGRWWRKVS